MFSFHEEIHTWTTSFQYNFELNESDGRKVWVPRVPCLCNLNPQPNPWAEGQTHRS